MAERDPERFRDSGSQDLYSVGTPMRVKALTQEDAEVEV